MVEENEIRLGLSQYERARVAARAAARGVFADEEAALRALFATASRPKRSRIRAFLALYHGLDARLALPRRASPSASASPSSSGCARAGARRSPRRWPRPPRRRAEAELALLARLARAGGGAAARRPRPARSPRASRSRPGWRRPAPDADADRAGRSTPPSPPASRRRSPPPWRRPSRRLPARRVNLAPAGGVCSYGKPTGNYAKPTPVAVVNGTPCRPASTRDINRIPASIPPAFRARNALLGTLRSRFPRRNAAIRRFQRPVPRAERRRCWRRERDSNPRDGFPPTHFPGVRLRPLGHLSGRRGQTMSGTLRKTAETRPPGRSVNDLGVFSLIAGRASADGLSTAAAATTHCAAARAKRNEKVDRPSGQDARGTR